jgi:hypothetical protein
LLNKKKLFVAPTEICDYLEQIKLYIGFFNADYFPYEYLCFLLNFIIENNIKSIESLEQIHLNKTFNDFDEKKNISKYFQKYDIKLSGLFEIINFAINTMNHKYSYSINRDILKQLLNSFVKSVKLNELHKYEKSREFRNNEIFFSITLLCIYNDFDTELNFIFNYICQVGSINPIDIKYNEVSKLNSNQIKYYEKYVAITKHILKPMCSYLIMINEKIRYSDFNLFFEIATKQKSSKCIKILIDYDPINALCNIDTYQLYFHALLNNDSETFAMCVEQYNYYDLSHFINAVELFEYKLNSDIFYIFTNDDVKSFAIIIKKITDKTNDEYITINSELISNFINSAIKYNSTKILNWIHENLSNAQHE